MAGVDVLEVAKEAPTMALASESPVKCGSSIFSDSRLYAELVGCNLELLAESGV